jgi:hypothetical protein
VLDECCVIVGGVHYLRGVDLSLGSEVRTVNRKLHQSCRLY